MTHINRMSCMIGILVSIAPTYAEKLPIVYSTQYNISFWGLENLHPFDSKKYGKVANYLSNYFHTPIKELLHDPLCMVSNTELLRFHTAEYLESLKSSVAVAKITELGLLSLLPNFIIQSVVLNPMRYATTGTRLATQLAWDNRQYAINLGGGFHHANANAGGGFCAFGDIQLAMLDIWDKKPNAKIMYIDLDAHQGDGVELGLETYIKNTAPAKPRLIVFDIYGRDNYPGANKAREYIQYNRPITDLYMRRRSTITDTDYLNQVAELSTIIPKEKPDFIFYNAGTDVYKNDPLGRLNVSKEGIKKRDELVFTYAEKNNIPIIMTLSGGYTQESALIVAESIVNLLEKVWKITPTTQPQPTRKWVSKPFKRSWWHF